MEKFRNATIKLRTHIGQWNKRRKLKYTDFSIISNNCWAGTAVYQPFGLIYNTPTVGLFIMDEDYIRFLERLEWHLKQELQFISPQKSRYYDKISNNGIKSVSYPIALLGDDVELHFLHYNDKNEALSKWNRRVKRINHNKLLIKMSIRDTGYDINSMLERFSRLPFKSKICFSPVSSENSCVVAVPELLKLNLVGGDETDVTLQHIDLYSLLNSIK